jgi:hypothetical protein
VNWPAGIVTCAAAGKEKDGVFEKGDVEYEPACKLYRAYMEGYMLIE